MKNTTSQKKKAPVLHRITGDRSAHERFFCNQKKAHVLISLEWLNAVPVLIG
jgi:hypothetical protein